VPLPSPAPLPASASASASSSASAPAPVRAYVRAYVGACERGFNPDNPDKPCQDAIVMEEHAPSDGVIFAVFDGHGVQGHQVAQLLQELLPSALTASPHFSEFLPVQDNIAAPGSALEQEELAYSLAHPGGGAGPKHATSLRTPTPAPPLLRRNVGAALVDALGALERALLQRGDIDCSLAGSTACIACVTDGDHLTVANVGDSRAMLFRRGGGGQGSSTELRPLNLSVDHKPTLLSETRRILLAGGSISPLSYEDGQDGPMRVWAGGVTPPGPGLAMSRSLGDTMGKLAGVCATPDIYTARLCPGEDLFLVLASDGLWEFMGGGEVAQVLQWAEARAGVEAREHAAAVEAVGVEGAEDLPPPRAQLQLALEELVSRASAKWREAEGSSDDIGIVLAEVSAAP
jgi:serine/threonine protein phosphatase PrpC